MSTVQNIIDGGLAWSTASDQDVLATDAQLIAVVDLAQKKYFSLANSINPAFFGKRDTVAAPGANTPWASPSDAEVIYRIEDASGERVRVVDINNQEAAYGPAVYHVGQGFYSTGTDPNPASETLTFFFGKQPATVAAVDTSLDGLWHDGDDSILELEVAMHLAVKDGRADDVAMLSGLLEGRVNIFTAKVAAFDASVTEARLGG